MFMLCNNIADAFVTAAYSQFWRAGGVLIGCVAVLDQHAWRHLSANKETLFGNIVAVSMFPRLRTQEAFYCENIFCFASENQEMFLISVFRNICFRNKCCLRARQPRNMFPQECFFVCESLKETRKWSRCASLFKPSPVGKSGSNKVSNFVELECLHQRLHVRRSRILK